CSSRLPLPAALLPYTTLFRSIAVLRPAHAFTYPVESRDEFVQSGWLAERFIREGENPTAKLSNGGMRGAVVTRRRCVGLAGQIRTEEHTLNSSHVKISYAAFS